MVFIERKISCGSLILIVGYLVAVSAEESTTVAASPKNSELNEPEFFTPEYILPCTRGDPAIDLCIQKAFNHLRPYLVRGLPELELPPIEPLTIPQLGMQNGQGAVRVSALFTNITAIGPGNFSINKVRVDIPTLRIDLHLTIPKIDLQGRYEVAGNVLLFPIQSRGDFWAVFSEVAAIARVQGVEEIRDGVRYMRISRLLIDFSLGRARFRVVDELNGNNVIGQAMNQFISRRKIVLSA